MAQTEIDRSKLFRKAALDRLSSPEELDVVMKIVRPRTWIATTAVAMALLAVVVWSIVGTIPTTVRAQGILIKTGGLFDIVAPASGPVAEFLVSEGDRVEDGQLVARLEQPELQARLANERQALEELLAQYEGLEAFTRTNLGLQTETLALQTETLALRQEAFQLQRNTLEETIVFSEQRLLALEEQLQNEETLLARGLITNRTVLQTRQEYYLTSDAIEQARNELQQLDVSGKQTTSERYSLTSSQQERTVQQEQHLENSRLAISQQERAILLLEERLVYETEVKSPGPGRVLEVQAKRGDLVSIGRPMVSLQPPGQNTDGLQAVIYVPPIDGKFVTPDMNVQLSPFAAPREEFGFLLGKVQYVSEFPSTEAGMVNTLGNPTLVQTLMGQGAPFAVYASLVVDDRPDNPSGFAWSSPRGQEITVNSGTLCNVTITVSERRPLELVMPFFRKVTGVS